MIISHYNVIVLCRQLAPGLCVRCLLLGRPAIRPMWNVYRTYEHATPATAQHFYDYILPALPTLLVLLSFLPLLPTAASVYHADQIERFHSLRQRRRWERKNNRRTGHLIRKVKLIQLAYWIWCKMFKDHFISLIFFCAQMMQFFEWSLNNSFA